jgi:peptidyl-prolyl cis-trans isomerase D
MLAQFRAFAKSPVATVLIALLLVSFAVWGVRDVFSHPGAKDAVIQAGSRSINSARFKSMFDRYRKSLEAQNQGQPISVAEAVSAGLDTRILDEVATDESLSAYLTRIGLRPSDELTVEVLRKQPRFFDPVSGRFDKKAYAAFLQENGVSAEEVEGELRDQAAQQHYITGMAAGTGAPRAYAALQAVYLAERRSFDYLALPPQSVGEPIKPTDADVQKFIDENAARLTRPETRTVSLVRFSAAQVAPTVTADPDKVKKRFEFEKDSLSTPEKRSIVQIPLANPGQAADVIARLKKGEAPAAVAKAVGAQPILYTDAPKVGVPDRKIAEAAFAMAQGEVKGPVAGDLGQAVLQVTAVAPGHAATLEEVRAKIEAEVKKQAASDKVYDLVQKYEDARNGGQTLIAAAKTVGVTVTQMPPFTAKGLMPNGQPLPAPQKLIQTAFALAPGADSDTLQAGPGEYYAIHLDAVTPPAKLTVDEVRVPVSRQLILQDLLKRLSAKADAAAERIRKGEPLAQVAQSLGASVGRGVDVQRSQAGKSFSDELLGRVFTAKTGEVVTGRDLQAGYVVAKLTGVATAPTAELAVAAEQARLSARQSLIQDLVTRTREAARAQIKPKVDAKRAKAAIGADAAAAGS